MLIRRMNVALAGNGIQLPDRAGLNSTNFQNSNKHEDSTNVQ